MLIFKFKGWLSVRVRHKPKLILALILVFSLRLWVRLLSMLFL